MVQERKGERLTELQRHQREQSSSVQSDPKVDARRPGAEGVTSSPPKLPFWKRYYRGLIARYLKFYLPPDARVLILGEDAARLAHAFKAKETTILLGTDEEAALWRESLSPATTILVGRDPVDLDGEYDVIVLSNVIGFWSDIQVSLERLRPLCNASTRLMITHYSALWGPVLRVGEWIGLKRKQPVASWLAPEDIENLLEISGFDVVRKNFKILMPIYIPIVAEFYNYILANLPFFWRLSLLEIVSARLAPEHLERKERSVTILIPTHNEKGNILPALQRIPEFGTHQEIIFVDGHSPDGTMEEIERQIEAHPELDIKAYTQDGKGKGDAVRKGYGLATGDILMILDADLTVPPEDLPKFYEALVSGKGEFINGTRLVYPMEKEAMRFLNTLGNKFFSRAFTYLLEQRFKDTLCGTKVMTRENYLKLAANRSYFGDFDPFGDFDLLFGSAKLNLKIVEVPIRYRARTYGDTSISRFRHGVILLRMCFFAFRKIKLT